jgi:hypothetical protein
VKVLVFAPHAALWQLAFQEALIADGISNSGHEVVYVSCGEVFNRFCIPMAANGLSPSSPAEQRAAVCKQCQHNDSLIRSDFKFSGPTLRDVLTARDIGDVDQALAALTKETAPGLIWNDIAVGKFALYQVMLRHKKFDLDFNETEWLQYLIDLRHTIYSTIAARKLLEFHKPDRVLVYNGLYSVNRVLCVLAEQKQIPAYYMHAGANIAKRLQTVSIGRGESFRYMPALLDQWKRFAEVPATSEELSTSTDYFLELLRGRNIFVYSKGKSSKRFDARKHFNVGEGQKLIVATMSSDDEEASGIMVGAQSPRQNLLFSSQIEWISSVLEYIKDRPDVFLVIRVHPRDFPNRRESKKSQHAHLLEKAFASVPGNAAVNWPSEGISLYDLIDQTDVFLNAWSSTGRDLPMLGIPVVIYSAALPWYPASLNYLGETREAYFNAIERALTEGWSFEIARRGYRWSGFELERATVFIGDSYPELENPRRNVLQKVANRLNRMIWRDYEQRRDLRRRTKNLRESAKVIELLEASASTILDHAPPYDGRATRTLEHETAALRVELRRLAGALYQDPDVQSESRLFGHLTSFAEHG